MSNLIASEIIVKNDRGPTLNLAGSEPQQRGTVAPSPESWARLTEKLNASGFQTGIAGPYSLSILAAADTYGAAFGAGFTRMASSQRGARFQGPDPSLFRPQGTDWAEVEGVVLVPTEAPEKITGGPSTLQAGPKPKVPYDHLDAPGDLRRYLRADGLHRRGVTGRRVRICVVDSGWWNHRWFSRRGLHVDVVLAIGAADPELDEVGHGTMVCASVMSLAPGAEVTLVKQPQDTAFPAFKHAISLQPQIIQNTWGTIVKDTPVPAAERLVAETVRHAVNLGIVVVFAGGNGKKLLPQQMPEAISVGGVLIDRDGEPGAASYASGYRSDIYPGRIVPDFCGLVGAKPEGVYIVMPTMPGSIIDRAFAMKPYPQGDGTDRPDDGWVVISGTSSGSGQVSGVIALLLQIRPGMDQAGVRRLLAETARPIAAGVSSEGNPAGLPIPNLATGYGLVDARAAAANAFRSRTDD